MWTNLVSFTSNKVNLHLYFSQNYIKTGNKKKKNSVVKVAYVKNFCICKITSRAQSGRQSILLVILYQNYSVYLVIKKIGIHFNHLHLLVTWIQGNLYVIGFIIGLKCVFVVVLFLGLFVFYKQNRVKFALLRVKLIDPNYIFQN